MNQDCRVPKKELWQENIIKLISTISGSCIKTFVLFAQFLKCCHYSISICDRMKSTRRQCSVFTCAPVYWCTSAPKCTSAPMSWCVIQLPRTDCQENTRQGLLSNSFNSILADWSIHENFISQ